MWSWVARWAVVFMLVLACAALGCKRKAQKEALEPIGQETVSPLPPLEEGPLGPEGEPAPPAARSHVVERGDSLYSLARKYYNDQSQWRRIFEANRDKITDPNDLKVGQTLIIP